MTTLLLLHGDAEPAPQLLADLKQAGAHVIGAARCETLVQDTIRLAPDLVLAVEAEVPAGMFAALAVLAAAHPVAVAVFTEDVGVEAMEQALASGIHAWIVRGYTPARLRSALQLAQARFRHERAQRAALASLERQLEERKLVDRAKGILMTAQQVREDEAFRLLRDAAMQGKERVGQVARRLIGAARTAEAINRAGQLRMLSQRLVKLYLLALLDVERGSALALQHVSVKRIGDNLSALPGLISSATFGDLLDGTLRAWHELDGALARTPALRSLVEIDAAAERLLDAAERLTGALEAASPVARMHAVNLAGRQRMLAQRYAKLRLIQAVTPAGQQAATALAAVGAAFEQALGELEQTAPAAGRERDVLRAAATTWALLRDGAGNPDGPTGRLAIARASEELLEQFDQLTEEYEHSLQVLVG